MDQLLRKAKRAKGGESITLSLNWKQAQGLMDQVDLWNHERFRLPEAYRKMMPIYGPSGVFGNISMLLEIAMYDQDKAPGRRTAA